MIKAKIKTTGQRIIVRPYSHEFYDFICCNEDSSIQGTLFRRDELEIIGDNQEDPPTVARTYWVAKHERQPYLVLFKEKPVKRFDKFTGGWWWESENMCNTYMILDSSEYPEVTFENSPMEVELVIKK